jgi:UDP-N-acetylglucosamine 4-epimerase
LAYLKGSDVLINGDGETTRDFCYIDNVVQANILAAMADVNMNKSENLVFNVAFGRQTSLSGLSRMICDYLRSKDFISKSKVVYENFRAGDIRHSLADIARTKNHLGYQPEIPVEIGIKSAIDWYFANHININEQGK